MAAQPMTSPQPDRVPFEAAAPRITLRNHFAHPYDSAIAAARTCYAPRLIGPEEVTDKQRLQIGASTFYGGHHTVYQHAHFEFGLENVSRQFVWSFLHAHPFYNSEQQSQRYVRLDHALAYLPPEIPGFGPAERAIYEDAIARAWGYYQELTALLRGDAREILSDIWHIGPMSHAKRVQKVDRQAEKRAIEVARYVLPVAAATTMVHTLSGIVLHRLWRMAAASDTPAEARAVIGEMVARVREIDPQFFDRFDNAPMEQEEMPEWSHANSAGASAAHAARKFAREFDARLAGRVSLLTDYSPHAPRVVADAYRAVLGLTESACSDEEAIDRLLNPARNAYRLETLNIGVHAPIMRALQHANFTFAKKISHTADSQDQRHRMVPGSRPLLVLTDTRSPDFVRPDADRRKRARPRSLRTRDGRRLGREKRIARPRRAPRNRAVPAAERESHSPRRNRLAAAPAAQVDDAHLLQRAGRDLPGLDGRGRAGPRGASFAWKIPRAAVLHPRRNRHAHLHRRLALLRRESLAGISKNRAANLIAARLKPRLRH